MGMVLGLTTIGDENIERVVNDPPLIWRIMAPDQPETYEESRQRQNRPSLLGRLLGKKVEPVSPPPDLVLGDSEGISTDLDKAWHGIYYLLTNVADGGAAPWSFLQEGGRLVGDIDVGFGPARVFTSTETKAIFVALQSLTDDALRARFDPADMAAKDIYPKIWSRGSPDEETIGYLLEYMTILRGFLQQAVEARVGIVVALS